MARRTASPAAVVVAGIVVIGLVILIVKWVLITAAILVIPFGVWWLWDRHTQGLDRRRADALVARRHEIESRAVIDTAGCCGWCGMRAGHRDHRTGARVSPRAFHHVEIEQTLAALPA
ncbi:hypothetical protein PHK61_26870 [Actinomycetospora lutea]|uniref:hypothetical protein n=1 Tax=Actinomycetospora lutea TaxID=663604 RepID=UPI0023651464|nr:hypothetical protein [Actinomycetospora lutea]MDD7942044.1 hypothetical protein [Actinomycetospora lutea]